MQSDTLLKKAVFELDAPRRRFDLFVYGQDGAHERIAYGLVQPYLAQLQEAERQYSDSRKRRSLVLDPHDQSCNGSTGAEALHHNDNCVGTTDGDQQVQDDWPAGSPSGGGEHGAVETAQRKATWFTKRTMDRFVRFVLNPEILERVVGLSEELLQLEEAIRRLSNGPEQYASEGDESQDEMVGNDSSSNQNGHGVLPAYLNNFSDRVLKCGVLQKRRLVIQREYALAAGRAKAAGFGVDTVEALSAFAECFGAQKLRLACTKYGLLIQNESRANNWQVDCESAGPQFATPLQLTPSPRTPLTEGCFAQVCETKDDLGTTLENLSEKPDGWPSSEGLSGPELTVQSNTFGLRFKDGERRSFESLREAMRTRNHSAGRRYSFGDRCDFRGVSEAAWGSPTLDHGSPEADCAQNSTGASKNEDEEGKRLRVAARVAFFEKGLRNAEWGGGIPRLKSRNSSAGQGTYIFLPERSPIAVAQEVGLRLIENPPNSIGNRKTVSVFENAAWPDTCSSDERSILAAAQKVDEGGTACRNGAAIEGIEECSQGHAESVDLQRSRSPHTSALNDTQQTRQELPGQYAVDLATPAVEEFSTSPECQAVGDSDNDLRTKTLLHSGAEPQRLFHTAEKVSVATDDVSSQPADADCLSQVVKTTDVRNRGGPRAEEGCLSQESEVEKRVVQQVNEPSDSEVTECRGEEELENQDMSSLRRTWNVDSYALISPVKGDGNLEMSTATQSGGAAPEVEDYKARGRNRDWSRSSVHLKGWKPLVDALGQSKAALQSKALPPKIPPEFKSTISPWQTGDLDSESSVGAGLTMSPDEDLPKRISWPTSLSVEGQTPSPGNKQHRPDSDDEGGSQFTSKEKRGTEVDDNSKDESGKVSLEAGSVVAGFIEQGWDDDAVGRSGEMPKPVAQAKKEDEEWMEQKMVVMSDTVSVAESVAQQLSKVRGSVGNKTNVANGEGAVAVPQINVADDAKHVDRMSDAVVGRQSNSIAVPVNDSTMEQDKKVETHHKVEEGAVDAVSTTSSEVHRRAVEICRDLDSGAGVVLSGGKKAKASEKEVASLTKGRVRRTKSEVPSSAYGLQRHVEHMNDCTADGEPRSEGTRRLGISLCSDLGSSYQERRDAWLREKRNKTVVKQEQEIETMADVIERKKSQILGELLERPAKPAVRASSKSVLQLGTVDEDLGFGTAVEFENWEKEAEDMLRTNRQMRVQELLKIWRAEVEKELSKKQEDDTKRSEGLQAQYRVEKVLARLETLLDHHSRGPLSVSVAAASITASINKARCQSSPLHPSTVTNKARCESSPLHPSASVNRARSESSPLHASPSKRVVQTQHLSRERFASGLAHEPGSCSKVRLSSQQGTEKGAAGGVSERRKGGRAVSVSSSQTGLSASVVKSSTQSRAMSAPSQRTVRSSRAMPQHVVRASSIAVTSSTTSVRTPKTKRATGKVAGTGSVTATTGNSISISLSLHVKKESVRPSKSHFTKEDVVQAERSDFVVNKTSTKVKPVHRRARSDGGWSNFAAAAVEQVLAPSTSASEMQNDKEGTSRNKVGGTVPGKETSTGQLTTRRPGSARTQASRPANTVKGTVDEKGRRKDRDKAEAAGDCKSVISSDSVHRLAAVSSGGAEKPAQRKCFLPSEIDGISLHESSTAKGIEEPKVRSFLRKGTGIGSGNRVKPMHLDSDMKFVISKPYMSPEPVGRSISVGVIEQARVTVTSFNCRIEENGASAACDSGQTGRRSGSGVLKARQRSKSALPRTTVPTAGQGKAVNFEREKNTGTERMEITLHSDPSMVNSMGASGASARKGAKSRALGSESRAQTVEVLATTSSCFQDSPCTQLLKSVLTKEFHGIATSCYCSSSTRGSEGSLQVDQGPSVQQMAEGSVATTPNEGARHMPSASGKQLKERVTKQTPQGAIVPETASHQGIRGVLRIKKLAVAAGGAGQRRGESSSTSRRDTKDTTIVVSESIHTTSKDSAAANGKNATRTSSLSSSHPQTMKTGTGEAHWPRIGSPWRFITCFQGSVTGTRRGHGEELVEKHEQWLPVKNRGLV